MDPQNQNLSPATKTHTAAPPNVSNQLEQEVRNIISKRKRGALTGILVVSLVAIYLIYTNISNNPQVFVIASLILLAILGFIYFVNAINYPKPRASYRLFNTIVYSVFSKLTIVFSILRIGSNTAEVLNPLHGFNPNVPSRPDLLLDTATTVGVGITAYKNLKSAALVEAYYKQSKYELTEKTGSESNVYQNSPPKPT